MAQKGAGMMSGWKTMLFSDAVEINPSVTLERGKTYPFVSMQAVTPEDHWVVPSETREYTGGGTKFIHGDTLMARITPSLEHGKIVRYSGVGQYKQGFGSTEFIVLRGKEGITNNNFVYYLVKSPRVHQYAISQMTGTSGRQRVPTESLSFLEVDIPPLPEQRAIAHILGTLDDKIELNRRQSETLEAMARALFQAWFVDFEPVRAKMNPPSPRGSPTGVLREGAGGEGIYALFPDRLVESELGPIPDGWKISPLDEIATYLNGIAWQKYKAQPGASSLPVIKIRELRDGRTSDTSDRAVLDVSKEYWIDDGDVIFSWSGSLLVKIWCGGQGILNQHLFKVTSEKFPKWFFYWWTQEHLERFQRIAADKATTMGHIKREHLNETKALIPSDGLLQRMSNIMTPLLEQHVVLSRQANVLTALRDTLLPKLISGQVRVADAERFLQERGL
ncbi:MAG: hypothetical protein Fur0018_24220 [Anaerolineales bacterium]